MWEWAGKVKRMQVWEWAEKEERMQAGGGWGGGTGKGSGSCSCKSCILTCHSTISLPTI